jgi:hypothetical protein
MGDRAECRLGKFPAAFVVQCVPNSLGYERTPPARPDAPVKLSHELIREHGEHEVRHCQTRGTARLSSQSCDLRVAPTVGTASS